MAPTLLSEFSHHPWFQPEADCTSHQLADSSIFPSMKAPWSSASELLSLSLHLFIPVPTHLWWGQLNKPCGLQDTWAPGKNYSYLACRCAQGNLLGLGTSGGGACITLLGNSEVGTPWVPAGQICWTLDFQTALITDPQPSTFWRVWSKYVIGEFLSQFCKVPSVSAVWLFYVVIKAVLGMRGRNEVQGGGGAGIDKGCLQSVLQSLVPNEGKPRGSAKHSFTYRLCSHTPGRLRDNKVSWKWKTALAFFLPQKCSFIAEILLWKYSNI